MRHYHKQTAYTLIEMMLVLTISAIIVMAGLMYVQSVYRGHLTNQAEELIIQVLTIAKNYHTNNNTKNAGLKASDLKKQYDGISTTWVANSGNIPAQYIKLNDDETVSILSPWSDDAPIQVWPGSYEPGNLPVPTDDSYLYITVQHLPNYACETLAIRLREELGGGRVVNGIPVTQTECAETEEWYGNVLFIVTNPLLY
ncbi:MAG: hypothetical protein K0R12_5 [Gammaproteobacteria bacterium]|jgi:prepilin-type N-terminal cleavage/methylation domain-containing protein|nr:hypothetical protein [Gammaproteobacteria bacterium]